MGELYEWAHPSIVAGDPILRAKHPYLNVPFFIGRAVLYFAVWSAIGAFLIRWSTDEDTAPPGTMTRRLELLSRGGLVLYGLTVTFAAIDWIMSLQPHWFSTIYGLLIMGGQGVAEFAFIIPMAALLLPQESVAKVVRPAQFGDLGSLMLAFVMIWAYLALSQLLITWSGNLPEEIAWYLDRLQKGWRVVAVALVIFHFTIPFLLLLSRAVKRVPGTLVKVSLAILAARLIDLFWLIAPEFHTHGIWVSWMDIVLPATLIAIWIGCFLWQLRGRPLLPVYDPQFEEALGPIIERLGETPKTAHD